ncbi:MAG: hypothetical protein AAFV93_15100 [Chloroflexota bacterium]
MSKFPMSIREINSLPNPEKWVIYETLIPEHVIADYDIDTNPEQKHPQVRYMSPKGSRAMELFVRRRAEDRDPIMYLNMADTFNNQILVLLVVVNDPDAQRFNIDYDQQGNPTNYGTSSRNKSAEIAAMNAGLAPGQIRRGLRAFRRSVPVFETFVDNMGHDMFMIEPLAYHNAIVFERYGFNYVRGLKDMKLIHEAFLPDGELHQRLDDDNPFRQTAYWNQIRGRSWAIHDGILGHPFTGFQMYKRIGKDAGIESFPNATW